MLILISPRFATFPRTFRNRIDFTDDSFLVDAVNLYASQSINFDLVKEVKVSLSRCLLGKVEALLASSPWREGRSECGLTSTDWREAGSQGWTAGGSCNESGCLTYHPHQVRPLTQLHFCFSFPPFFVHKSSIIPRQEEH